MLILNGGVLQFKSSYLAYFKTPYVDIKQELEDGLLLNRDEFQNTIC